MWRRRPQSVALTVLLATIIYVMPSYAQYSKNDQPVGDDQTCDACAYVVSGKTVTPEETGKTFASTVVTSTLAPVVDGLSIEATLPFPQNGEPISLTPHGSEFTTTTRMVVGKGLKDSGTELPTVMTGFNSLDATWLDALIPFQGTYLLWAWNTLDHASRSNYVTVIIGSGAKQTICAGGRLNQHASTDDVIWYQSHYETLNCIWRQTPRCAEGYLYHCTP
jgi:hypothetical protein